MSHQVGFVPLGLASGCRNRTGWVPQPGRSVWSGHIPGTGRARCGCQEPPRCPPGRGPAPLPLVEQELLENRGGARGPQKTPKMNLLSQVSTLLQTLQAPEGPFLQPWHWLSSWVSSSRQGIGGPETQPGLQVVAGAASTTAFFLCEGLLGQHFDVVPNGVATPQPGDLFLFPLASGSPGWCGAHAGVYCGDGEIIHLEGSSGTSPSGIVAKHGKNHLLRTRGPAKVLRRKGGMDVATLQRRVRAAMDQALEYNAVTCNCIHFALALLGLGQLAGAMVSPALQ
ncbi:uncharacterized protein LOC102098630 isoform X3 [Columba livia]|uniref:uncharacterized protein LOC102098630 isoform X3 n=1 Tax=Columba livia TaxID=8932 RepID=UPI0031BB608A